MTKIYAQHGPAKGKKIQDGLKGNYLSGSIFSLNDEGIDSVYKYYSSVEELTRDNTYLDPQFYYSTFEASVLKKLNDLEDFPSQIVRRDWRKRDNKIINFLNMHAERSKKISNTLITPGFYINDIDWKFDYSLEIYSHCVNEYQGFSNYAMSLMISTSFFANKANVEELIEELNELEAEKDSIYLVICHESRAEENNYELIDQTWLANILYTLHQLKESGFKLIIGYNFMNSVLFSMMGAEIIATGWFNTLRKFDKSKFEITDSFGRRKKRYTSLPLLSNIMVDDLKQILDSVEIDFSRISSGSSLDDRLSQDFENASFVELEHQFWESINSICQEISQYDDLKNRVNIVRKKIIEGISIYQLAIENLESKSQVEAAKRLKTNSKHLHSWLNAIDIFKSTISLI